jgi:hypothetical protein
MAQWNSYPYAQVPRTAAQPSDPDARCCGMSDEAMMTFLLSGVTFAVIAIAIILALYVDRFTKDIARLDDHWLTTSLRLADFQTSVAASLSALNATLFART